MEPRAPKEDRFVVIFFSLNCQMCVAQRGNYFIDGDRP